MRTYAERIMDLIAKNLEEGGHPIFPDYKIDEPPKPETDGERLDELTIILDIIIGEKIKIHKKNKHIKVSLKTKQTYKILDKMKEVCKLLGVDISDVESIYADPEITRILLLKEKKKWKN